jgi:dTMP kinase
MAEPILIAIEGIDGAGKTTQIKMLHKALERSGLDVVASKEPTSGQWGRIIKESATSGRLTPEEELDLFIKDRTEHVENLIAPAMEAGRIVLLDRYFYSTIAYQGSRGANVEQVKSMMESRFPVPDTVFILDIDADLSAYRIAHVRGEDPNHFEERGNLTTAREIFNAMAGSNICRIDGALSIPEVHRRIMLKFVSGSLKAKRCFKAVWV